MTPLKELGQQIQEAEEALGSAAADLAKAEDQMDIGIRLLTSTKIPPDIREDMVEMAKDYRNDIRKLKKCRDGVKGLADRAWIIDKELT